MRETVCVGKEEECEDVELFTLPICTWSNCLFNQDITANHKYRSVLGRSALCISGIWDFQSK